MRGPPFSVGADEVAARYAERYAIDCLDRIDALPDAPAFRRWD